MDAKKSDFLRNTFFFNGKYTKEDTFSVKNGIDMGKEFIPGTGDSPYKTLLGTPCR